MQRFFILIIFTLFLALPTTTIASDKATAPTLTKEMAVKALQGIRGEVVSVSQTEIPGFYMVAMQMEGKIVPIFLDKSGSYLFSGTLIRIQDRTNLAESYYKELNPVNVSEITKDEGLTLGSPDAKQQLFVFTDPHCPYCTKMHQVLHEAVAANPDLAFHIKLIPFKASSKEISKTILCNKSMEQLEMAFAGKPLPASTCETDATDVNLSLARKIGINSTPALVLPNGQIANGYRQLEELLTLIEKNQVETATSN